MTVANFGCSGFAMFYIAWKFRAFASRLHENFALTSCVVLVQVFDQPDEKETGGAYFPMAVNNLCTS
jgi:hypothetical protein